MRWIRSFLLALLISLLMGFAIGTWLRMRMERSPVYIGAAPAPPPVSALAAEPLQVGLIGAGVLQPGENEEKV